MRVRPGVVYHYRPVPMNRVDSHVRATEGDYVRVVNLRGAPPCGTMGQCHVEDLDGHLLGMVSVNSLQPAPREVRRQWHARRLVALAKQLKGGTTTALEGVSEITGVWIDELEDEK